MALKAKRQPSAVPAGEAIAPDAPVAAPAPPKAPTPPPAPQLVQRPAGPTREEVMRLQALDLAVRSNSPNTLQTAERFYTYLSTGTVQ